MTEVTATFEQFVARTVMLVRRVATAQEPLDADSMQALVEAAQKLQGNNRQLKDYVARLDAEAVHEAMHGGFLGLGCNDNKLISVLCSRTKDQLRRTASKYRELYDLDLREDVLSKTTGDYGQFLKYSLADPATYFADMIDLATEGWGASETHLIEIFVTNSHAKIQEGKAAWEARHDKALIDHLDDELSSSYDDLQDLIFKLFKGKRDEGTETDEELAKQQAAELYEECTKSKMFGDFKEDVAIRIIGLNNTMQNMLVARIYEDEYDKSLSKALDRCSKEKLKKALRALLIPTPDFIAQRLKHAMEGWGTNTQNLVRILSGLDGLQMVAISQAFERKYGVPLTQALKSELSGSFLQASCLWVNALQDPASGLEKTTEQEIGAIAGDGDAVVSLVDALLAERSSLAGFLSKLDAETLREACKGFGTNDERLISVLCSRSKAHLARISAEYWAAYDQGLPELIEEECGGWYAYLARFLVLPTEHSDARLLDLAMDGLGSNKRALIEFLCARPPARVRAAKSAWEQRHDASLVDRIVSEVSGDFRTLALALLRGKRFADDADDTAVDMDVVDEQAAQLHDNQGDSEIYSQIICSCSPAHLAAVSEAYENEYDCSISRTIGIHFDSNMRSALRALLQPSVVFYASQLKAAFQGWGATNRAICRILGSLDKSEAVAVAAVYERKYGEPLRIRLAKECSGNYKRLAVSWITLPDELEEPNASLTIPSIDEMDAEAAELPELDVQNEDENEIDAEAEPQEEEAELELDEPPAPPEPMPPAQLVAPPASYVPQVQQPALDNKSASFPGYVVEPHFAVAVPPGCPPGSMLSVVSPFTRQELRVMVPAGVWPGTTFMVHDGSLRQNI
eukprot:CAMPEP_0119306596 /NCGR_PEP_ID=MMETSP1333-20130426/7310_1 /TAXON_ID=418940 /ORGANISM="Scyphosphaera apsteinii, Strain RCC1455" /LENGTH=857 /DNA_ID=CAMNT_0007309933 /DNA_START=58 /DNA_END=2631 /DNA_ORIENTATION=+